MKDCHKAAQGKLIFKSANLAGYHTEDEKHIQYLFENIGGEEQSVEDIMRFLI